MNILTNSPIHLLLQVGGFIDDVIKPQSTRKRIAVALDNLQNKELTSPYKKTR